MAVADPPAVDLQQHPTKPEENNSTPATQPAAAAATTTTDNNGATEKSASAPADDDDVVNPPDFQGEVLSNDELPSEETIRKIGDYIVLDRHGKTHTFKTLYTGRSVARRILIIFVRHFFCGVGSRPPPFPISRPNC